MTGSDTVRWCDYLKGTKLLATDLDGTLLGGDGLVSPEARRAWRKWRERGGKVAVVTGRPFSVLLELLTKQGGGREFPYPDAVVCEERDAYLRARETHTSDTRRADLNTEDLRAGETRRGDLSAEDSRAGESLVENSGTEAPPAGDSPTYSWQPLDEAGEALRRERDLLTTSAAIAKELINQAASRGLAVKRSEPDVEWARGYVELQFPSRDEAERARTHAASLLGSDRALVPVRNGRLVALRHPHSRKGPSLARLAAHLGLAPSEVIAVGDSHNDLTMLDGSHGFKSAAVANADEEVKEAVRAAGGILIPHPSSLGVAWLMETLVACRQMEEAV